MSTQSGELATRPLPAVLLDLYDELATGKLSLRRGRVSKSVDLVNGNPVSTASTPRDETLGHFLVSSGVISEDQHRFAVARAAEIGGKLGEALVALQILTVEALIEQLGKQARHKLVQALRWPQGAWRFDATDHAVEGMQLRMVDVVLGGLKETAIEAPERLARLDSLVFEFTERGVRLKHELKKTFGDAIVAALVKRAPIADIERAAGDRAKARMAIDAMLVCDALTSAQVEVGLGAAPSEPRAPTRPRLGTDSLYDQLFDDDLEVPAEPATQPLSFEDAPVNPDDSGILSKDMLAAAQEQISAARQAIAAEHQRLLGADHYAALKVNRRARISDVLAAFEARLAELEREAANLFEERDRARVDEIRKAYDAARSQLADGTRRAAYDRELAGGELVQVPPAIDTELGFRTAEELMARREWVKAIGQLKTVIQRSPNEADYLAALGWCEWKANGEHHAAADAAHAQLNAALSINPDHAAAHDYKGRIDAALHADNAEAVFHLERALDLEPTRADALATLETLLIASGELRRLERVLKRQLFRLRGSGGAPEATAWLRLAKLYLDHLDDPTSGATAAANAHKLIPNDPEAAGVIARVQELKRNLSGPIREGWSEALADPKSGAELVQSTAASGHADAAFLAASTMVALDTAEEAMAQLYEKQRITQIRPPSRALVSDDWTVLRHKEDTLELGALFELVAPAVHALAPMSLAEGGVEDGMRVDDLPPGFGKLLASYSTTLGVTPPPVYARVELGAQVHVLATDPPVLMAGDDALTSPERIELVFRIVRALTLSLPGRAVGASRPGRVLRAIMLAVFREASGSDVGAEDPLGPRAGEAVATLPDKARTQARAAAMRLMSRGGNLNLSLWSRSLSRTADRAGMLLCADVPAAFSGAREVGELDKDLVEFAFSAAHVNLRRQLGLA